MFYQKVHQKMAQKPRRLFIFAAHDPKDHMHGVVNDSLLIYLSALHELGDIALYMDNNVANDQLSKFAPYVLYAGANRHNEYDFGSYKRAYIWAHDNLKLFDYDWVYMVNDSMYAPMHPLLPILEQLETYKWNATGIVCNPTPRHPHIQSWFIGMDKSVFMAPWFDAFMRSVTPQTKKACVTSLYEQGFTRHLIERNIPWGCKYTIKNRGIYNKVKSLYNQGFPFMKKLAFGRHNGGLGRQILYVLNRVPPKLKNAIIKNAARIYGPEYISKLLTDNPLKIAYRNIRYLLYKVFHEGI
jgi:lipopolysaccharide biosynthesis protein